MNPHKIGNEHDQDQVNEDVAPKTTDDFDNDQSRESQRSFFEAEAGTPHAAPVTLEAAHAAIDDKSILQRAYDLIDNSAQRLRRPPTTFEVDQSDLESTAAHFESNRMVSTVVARAQAKAASAYASSNGGKNRLGRTSMEPGAEYVQARAPGLSPAFYLNLIRRSNSRTAREARRTVHQGAAVNQESADVTATLRTASATRQGRFAESDSDPRGEYDSSTPSDPSRETMPNSHSRGSVVIHHSGEGEDNILPLGSLPSQHPRPVEEIEAVVSADNAIEQAITSDSNSSERSRRLSRRKLLLRAAFLFSVVLVAVVVAVVVSGRKSSSDEQSATTSMDPPTLSCDGWYSQTQPNVITQCACVGKITVVADDVATNYRQLKANGFIQAILPGFGNTLDSCDPTNQALVWLASATGTPSSNANLRQRYVLALLYILWNGVKWQVNTGWLSSGNECSWTDVICDVNAVVNEIDLHDNGLSGNLGSYVPLLTSLTSLLMDQNSLHGSLASEFGSMSNLNMLVLEYNQLTGTLPSALVMLSQLHEFKLGYNRLSGTIPTWFGQMQSLITLSLSNNTLGTGGAIEKNDGTPSSGKVKQSAFPTELGLLTNLQVLELGATGINGTLPTELFNLGNSLQAFDVSGNFVSGSIPTLVGNLSLMSTFRLSISLLHFAFTSYKHLVFVVIVQMVLDHNDLTGTIPTEFANCTDLITLDLSNNHLTGTMPRCLGGLGALGKHKLVWASSQYKISPLHGYHPLLPSTN
jgi:hypothetical protein